MPARLVSFVLTGLLAAAAVHAAPPPLRFTVEEFQVEGANPLDRDQSRKALAPFLGEHEGLEGLKAAADALEAKLRAAGFGFHRVVLPPQTLQEGVVRLTVVEFEVGAVAIEKNRHFNEANVRRALPVLVEGEPPNIRRLSRALRFANRHPSRQLSVSFLEGEDQRTVEARVRVDDRPPGSFFSVLQNTGTEQTGEYRLSVGYQYSNLFNRDHGLSLIYTVAPDESDAVTQAALSYRVPFYSHPGALSFSYTDSNVDSGVVQEFFTVSGEGTVADLRYEYSLPDLGRYRHTVSAGYADKLFENQVTFEGEPVDGGGRVRTNPFSLGYGGRYGTLNHTVAFEVTALSNQPRGSHSEPEDYAAAGLGADPDWSAVRYLFNYDWRFTGQWLLRVKHSGQIAGEPLVPGEQFGLGGMYSVRGYEERSVLGDNGRQTSLEVWTPDFGPGAMNALIFYDTGRAEFEPAEVAGEAVDATGPREPAGAGLGLRWVWKERLSVRLDAAKALETVDGTDTEKGDTRTHLSVFYRF